MTKLSHNGIEACDLVLGTTFVKEPLNKRIKLKPYKNDTNKNKTRDEISRSV